MILHSKTNRTWRRLNIPHPSIAIPLTGEESRSTKMNRAFGFRVGVFDLGDLSTWCMKITTWDPHPGATTTSFGVVVVYEGTGSLDSSFSCTTTTTTYISKSGGNSTRPSMKNWMIENYVPNTPLDEVGSLIKQELARLVCETFMSQNLRHKVGDHIHNIASIRLHILYEVVNSM